MNPEGKFALATVTTENYVQWSMVMIHSFLKSNPWFNGDIVIISNNFSEQIKNRFRIFPRLKFIGPSDLLIEKVTILSEHIPGFKRIAPMFYSLELFNLAGYKKVLFLDSDMLVIKPVSEVFEFEDLLVASAESCWYAGKGRRTDTYEALPDFPDPAMFIKNPVNSGFMVVDHELITDENYHSLINMIEPELWANKNTFHADQLIINLFFIDRITLVDARYNFRPANAHEMKEKESVNPEDAKIIHYYRHYKPWNFNEVFELSQHDLVHLKAFKQWYDFYFDFLRFYHLQNKIINLRKDESDHS